MRARVRPTPSTPPFNPRGDTLKEEEDDEEKDDEEEDLGKSVPATALMWS